jgi:N-acetylglucosamine-6-phosphate deacetylase
VSILEGRLPDGSGVVRIEFGGVINAVDELIHPPETEIYICPGFIDLQVNGFAGVDYNDPASSHDEIAGSIRRMFETGVSKFLPTIITGSEERITGALRNLADFAEKGSVEAQAIAGFHVEGPHISPEDGPRGSHPQVHIRPPNIDEFERWQEAAKGGIRLITVSPEWPEMPAYVRHITRRGVVASIGHTKATREQIVAAVDAGATKSTHLGNAAHSILPKTDNYIWDQLVEDRLTAGFVVDGIHIPEVFLRASLRSKGVERSLLVTDAVMPTMCEPGPYRLGEVDVELHANGSVTVRGGTRLAGSALRMDEAVGNTVRLGGVSLSEAISMATITPARIGRVAGRQRGLNTGDKADLVRFRWNRDSTKLTVIETVISGQEVYRARS